MASRVDCLQDLAGAAVEKVGGYAGSDFGCFRGDTVGFGSDYLRSVGGSYDRHDVHTAFGHCGVGADGDLAAAT